MHSKNRMTLLRVDEGVRAGRNRRVKKHLTGLSFMFFCDRKIFYVSMDTTPLGGGQGVDYIDTMKFFGEANLLYSLITFRADHGDVAADTIAFRLGPVRGIRRCYGATYSVSTLENIKAGDYCAWLDWYFPPHVYNPDDPMSLDMDKIRGCLNIHDHPLVITVEGKRMENRTKLPQVKED